ncbi:hypothetical protein LWE69_20985 [Paenibacillus sp. UKAQ_18]|nr:hypothetical protein [Paenibacillus sp. UKAQ_18]
MLMIISVIILLAAGIVAAVEYLQPERHLLQVLANAMFDHWVPSITLLSVVFVGGSFLPSLEMFMPSNYIHAC